MTATASGRIAGRPWVLWVVMGVAIVVTVLVLPAGQSAYDLDSAEPNGYRAMALLLGSFDGTIDRLGANDVDAPAARRLPVILIPTPAGGSPTQVARWRAFAEAGGTLVLGAPVDGLGASYSTEVTGPGGVGAGAPPSCEIDRLRGIGRVKVPSSAQPLASGGGRWCFGGSTEALVVEQRIGAGTVVTVSTPELFTNAALGMADEDRKVVPADQLPGNGLVAEALLAPDGRAHVGVVTEGVVVTAGSGAKGFTDFISPGVKLGIAEMFAAFLYYAWFRARRHGRRVRETSPVQIAGSELVDAIGNLRERQSDPQHVARRLRAQARRELARVHGLPPTASAADVAAVLAARSGGDVAEITRALGDDVVSSDAELLALVRTLDTIRQEALHV